MGILNSATDLVTEATETGRRTQGFAAEQLPRRRSYQPADRGGVEPQISQIYADNLTSTELSHFTRLGKILVH